MVVEKVYVLEKDLHLDVLPFSPSEGMTREQIVSVLLASNRFPINVEIVKELPTQVIYKDREENFQPDG